ncbi:ABC-2 type transport system ATP-binding protein/Cu-processing system ATP-binding protein [Desulfitobacterium sp. LBE]|uniref:ABC transporter related n=1 Tax=Desulfitobacterium hafniense (strain DSM 10664 / DCB-2) TaxID=272564 RepID=B8FZJ9_DESHD|nr:MULTISPECIES: ABC transporter ATP-binding protein [Desulfitobacterium]ACL18282.1 ABC transporter related [Desulfitobacterium hafniense DCB-2]TWH58803.1 ABC-2 type transport system ATP-binding protein/Cu-processing system ATP-binding protein [Desulfitobacterium sp. LBE]
MEVINTLEVKYAQKFYGPFQAVKDINLTVEKGEIYALLGHNGAGKSTLIKMILGLVKASAGMIEIEGLNYDAKNKEIKKRVGYLPERMNFYDNLTAWETISFYAKLKGITRKRCEEVLEQVGLREAEHRRVGTFSKGMQQRLGLAQAIIHKPDLLVLDEPTTGLDPIGILELKAMIRNWNKEGTTILFSSHNLNDVEELAQRIGIMNRGEMIAQGSLAELQDRLGLPTKIKIDLAVIPVDLEEILVGKRIKTFQLEEKTVSIDCPKDKKTQVITAVMDGMLKVLDLRLEEPGLNSIYQNIMAE